MNEPRPRGAVDAGALRKGEEGGELREGVLASRTAARVTYQQT
jgi:hypothetical protein